MIQQCYKLVVSEISFMVKAISDDTDVFVLAWDYFPKDIIDDKVLMEVTKPGKTVTNIGTTVRKHELITKLLLLVNSLSGCDTVSHYYAIHKKTNSHQSRWKKTIDLSSGFSFHDGGCDRGDSTIAGSLLRNWNRSNYVWEKVITVTF